MYSDFTAKGIRPVLAGLASGSLMLFTVNPGSSLVQIVMALFFIRYGLEKDLFASSVHCVFASMAVISLAGLLVSFLMEEIPPASQGSSGNSAAE